MIKNVNTIRSIALIAAIVILGLAAPSLTRNAFAMADHQSFGGGGLGVEFLSRDGSGTGFYFQAFGGYAFTPKLGFGLHAGYSNVGSVGTGVMDFGSFMQVADPESGFYGKLYIDGVSASVSGGGFRHGINGSQVAFAPGVGLGLEIPTLGDFHMVPEVSYRLAFFNQTVSLIQATFNLVWDF